MSIGEGAIGESPIAASSEDAALSVVFSISFSAKADITVDIFPGTISGELSASVEEDVIKGLQPEPISGELSVSAQEQVTIGLTAEIPASLSIPDIDADVIPTGATFLAALSASAQASVTFNVSATVSAELDINLSVNAVYSPTALIAAELNIPSPSLLGLALVDPDTASFDFSVPDVALGALKFISPEFSAQVDITAVADLLIPLNASKVTGDLLDISNNSVFQFTVNNTLVDMREGFICVEDFNVSYDGRQLTFTELTSPFGAGPGNASFEPEQDVSIVIDWANGGTPSDIETIFVGKIRSRTFNQQNRGMGVAYQAVDLQYLANDVTLINTTNRPDVQFTIGTTITSTQVDGTEISTTFSKSVADAIQDLFDLSQTALSSEGVPTSIGLPGLEQFTAKLPETVDLTNQTFFTGLKLLAAIQPGVRPFFNTAIGKWQFLSLEDTPRIQSDISSACYKPFTATEDTSDRFTAVHLYARDNLFEENTFSDSITINDVPGVALREVVNLEPLWAESLENTWTLYKAMGVQSDISSGFFVVNQSDYTSVFRRYQIPGNLTPQFPGSETRLSVVFEDNGQTLYKPVKGVVKFGKKTVFLRYPAIHPVSNPYVEGLNIPLDVILEYYPIQFGFTYASSTSSAGTPTFTTTTVNVNEFLDEVRVPQSGYEGTAFTNFNIERTLHRFVSPTEVTTENARKLLNQYKDVVLAGQVEIEGDILRDFLSLNAKLEISHPTVDTGIQSTPAYVTGFSYTFGKRGVNQIQITNNYESLLL